MLLISTRLPTLNIRTFTLTITLNMHTHTHTHLRCVPRLVLLCVMLTRMLTSLPQCRRRWQGSDRTQWKYSYPNRPWWAIYVANWRPACSFFTTSSASFFTIFARSSGLLIMSATTMTTKRESPKCRAFAFVAASSSSLSFVFVFVFVFGIRRSLLAVFAWLLFLTFLAGFGQNT